MTQVRNLSYLVLGVSDFDAWEAFATEVVGMQVGERGNDGMKLRMDDHAYRIILEHDPQDDIRAAGWQVDDEASLGALVERARGMGVAIERADEQLRARRQVVDLYTCVDPNGVTHEIFVGPARAMGNDPFRSTGIRKGFRTGSFGIGHIHPWANSEAETVKFFMDAMGLELSGYMRPEQPFNITFLHAACRCYHAVAVAQFASEKRLGHIGLEVNDLNDVGFAYDRALKAGVPITATLGRHPNAENISFYMRTPSGFELEIGNGEIMIPEENWQAQTFLEFSEWGHDRSERFGR